MMFNLLNVLLTFLIDKFLILGNFIVNDALLSFVVASVIILAVIRFFRNLRHK